MTRTSQYLLATGLMTVSGCDASEGGLADGGGFEGDPGVGQGGGQDFGLFRSILDQGLVPHPSTLDDVGFFNEHKIELPAAECGNSVCIHGRLGVRGNMITGSNCTIVLIGMNTPLDPSTVPRPPLDLAVVVDGSGSMAGAPIGHVQQGLVRMLDALEPEDTVSLVRFSDSAEVLADGLAGDDEALEDAILGITADGETNLYDGLRVGFELATAHAEEGRQRRVILLSDGVATTGVESDDRIRRMAADYGIQGFSLTTIGVGTAFDVALMRGLAEDNAGSFYFLEDSAAVQEVFVEEVEAFMIPLGADVSIDLALGPGYALRAVNGTRLATFDEQRAAIAIPSVQLAHRRADDDVGMGRRGGGGAIVAELVPRGTPGEGDLRHVGTLTLDYLPAGASERAQEEVKIVSDLDPGDTPDQGLFVGADVEKAFVALNVFAAFQIAATRASGGDVGGAFNTLIAFEPVASQWLTTHPDPDIEQDLEYVRKFIEILRREGGDDPPIPPRPAPEPWPVD